MQQVQLLETVRNTPTVSHSASQQHAFPSSQQPSTSTANPIRQNNTSLWRQQEERHVSPWIATTTYETEDETSTTTEEEEQQLYLTQDTYLQDPRTGDNQEELQASKLQELNKKKKNYPQNTCLHQESKKEHWKKGKNNNTSKSAVTSKAIHPKKTNKDTKQYRRRRRLQQQPLQSKSRLATNQPRQHPFLRAVHRVTQTSFHIR